MPPDDDDDLRSFLDSELADLPVGSAEDPVNFVEEVVGWLTRWATTYDVEIGLEKPAYCCFVKCDRVREVAETQGGFSLRKYFRDDTPQNLLGQIYLCSPTLQSVFSKDVVVTSIDDLEKEVTRLGLTEHAIVVFNAASKQAFWRYESTAELVPIKLDADATDQLNSEDFDEELTRFHVECTATPQGYVRPWKSAKKLLTKDDLELEIRDHLCLFLKLKHKKWLLVTRESFEPTGRADLKVYFIAERVSFFLELKVFRAFERSGTTVKSVSQNETIDWGKMGVAQAHSYRIANDPTGAAYACCYDARGTDSEIDEVKDYAESMSVRYRRYFIYQSAEAFQRSFIR
jgi:hypothetical protein